MAPSVVLVTGVSRFIGAHLAARLAADPSIDRVLGVDTVPPPRDLLRGMGRAEFDRYWAQVHGPLAATIPTIRRYVQAHLSPGTREAGAAPYDGLAITWFDDVAAMRAGAATEAYAQTRADEANFLAGELPFVITTERVTFPR